MSSGYDGKSSKPDHHVEPIKTLKGHTDDVFAVAFSPDKQRFASGGYDRIIRLWDLDLEDKGKSKQTPNVDTLYGHEGTVMDIVFSEDSKLLISGGKDKSVRIWDVNEGRAITTLTPGNGIIRSVAARNFEDDIHCGGENGWSIWSTRGRKVVSRLWNGGATVGAIAFDPAGQFLAAAGDDGNVRIWNNEYHAPKVLESKLANESINGLVISSDSRWLAAAGTGKVIHVWRHGSDWNDWEKVTPLDPKALTHDGRVWGLCFDPKGRWLFSSNTNKNMRLKRWNIPDWSLLNESEEMDYTVNALACDSEGNNLIGGDSVGQVTVWDTKDFTTKSTTQNVQQAETDIWSVALSSNPRYIFSGNSNGHVYRWMPSEWTSGRQEEKINTSEQDATVNPTINSVSFNQKLGWVAAGGDGNSIEIYDINLKHRKSLEGHEGTIWWLTFDHQGSRLAAGGTDRILRVFNLDEIKNLESDSPRKLYQEAQEMTGLSVDKDEIIVGKLQE